MVRRKHSSSFKAQVALAAIRGDKTVAEIASKMNIHPAQVQAWKAEALNNLGSLFEKEDHDSSGLENQISELERKVGQLTVENDFLKKNWEGYARKKSKK